jgi:hypothetical protein
MEAALGVYSVLARHVDFDGCLTVFVDRSYHVVDFYKADHLYSYCYCWCCDCCYLGLEHYERLLVDCSIHLYAVQVYQHVHNCSEQEVDYFGNMLFQEDLVFDYHSVDYVDC